MNKTLLSLVLIAAWLPAEVCAGQAELMPIPGSIRLLPGYLHQKEQGIDSNVGKIWRKDGVEIHYDIGKLAGNYAECKSCGWTADELWRKKQTINGQESILVFTKSKRLVVVFPESNANFYAAMRSEEDMVEMLLMLCTFQKTRSINK